jgi:putative ABC transport system permease protein
MRPLDILRTAVASTFRSKLRTSLTVIAIFIGAFTLTITSAIGTGVSDYIGKQVASIGADNVLTVTKTAATGSATGSGPAKYDSSTAAGSTQGDARGPAGTAAVLTSADIAKLEATKSVIAVAPSATVSPDWIRSSGGTRYVLPVNDNAGLTRADLAAGAQLDQNTSADQLLIPTTYVTSLGFSSAKQAVGEPVTIRVTDYTGRPHVQRATIVGVQNTTLFGSGAGLNRALTTDLRTSQNIGRPSSVKTSYRRATVTFASGSSTAQVDALKRTLKDEGFTGQTVADQLGAFQTVINGIVYVLDAFAVIALLAAGFGIVNTLLMSVQERTREIGLMKAMGMGGGRVYALFSTEAVFIGFLGSALGAAVAAGVGTLLSGALARSLLSSLPGLHLMVFTPAAVISIVLIVMAIAFLAGTLPARRAARQNPIEALRYE